MLLLLTFSDAHSEYFFIFNELYIKYSDFIIYLFVEILFSYDTILQCYRSTDINKSNTQYKLNIVITTYRARLA